MNANDGQGNGVWEWLEKGKPIDLVKESWKQT